MLKWKVRENLVKLKIGKSRQNGKFEKISTKWEIRKIMSNWRISALISFLKVNKLSRFSCYFLLNITYLDELVPKTEKYWLKIEYAQCTNKSKNPDASSRQNTAKAGMDWIGLCRQSFWWTKNRHKTVSHLPPFDEWWIFSKCNNVAPGPNFPPDLLLRPGPLIRNPLL